MSPTLLELVTAAFLLYVAWQIGKLLAPYAIRAFLSFWRDPTPPSRTDPTRPEKKIIPPPAETDPRNPYKNYGSTRSRQ